MPLLDSEIRKIRKKLQQIEHLETLSSLNLEETAKVLSKDKLRDSLLQEMKRRVESSDAVPSKRNCEFQKEDNDSHHHDDGFKNRKYKKCCLQGHEDLISAIALDSINQIIVTGSKDTTILVWSCSTEKCIKSLRGHCGPISGLQIAENYSLISTSEDCYIKIWSLKSGDILKSIYTYNEISVLDYSKYISIGSKSGKLEVYNINLEKKAENISEFAITSLSSYQSLFGGAGYLDGSLRVFSIPTLELLYVFHRGKRSVNCLHFLSFDVILYGDFGSNVKALNWKENTIKKIPSHSHGIGITDTLLENDSCLIVSSYNLDNGNGSLNIYFKDDFSYICSLFSSSRILTLAVSKDYIVTGGKELNLWKIDDSSERLHVPFSRPPKEIETDSSEDDEENEENKNNESVSSSNEIQEKHSVFSCILS